MILSIALIIGILPVCDYTVKAETYSGKCGDEVYWEFDTKTGVMRIYGNGPITDHLADYMVGEVKSIEISDGVTSIGLGVFRDYYNLVSITIPNSVTNIGDSAFSGCSGLTDITIPDSVTSIGESAFSECSSLNNITIPSGIYVISYRTFRECDSLTTVTIKEGVLIIGAEAFEGCSSLSKIIMPQSVNSIYNNAFKDCYKLSEVRYCGTEDDWKNVSLENGNTAITSVIMYSGHKYSDRFIEEIGRTIRICEVCGQSDVCWGNCGDNVHWMLDTSIGDMKIYGKGKMEIEYRFESYLGMCVFPWTRWKNCIKKVEITSGVTNIDDSTFSDCVNLKNVVISEDVTEIGDFAFKDCHNLTSILIPNGVLKIGYGAFESCSGLANVTIPKSLMEIGSYAFDECDNLSNVYYSGTENDWNKISIGSNNYCLISALSFSRNTEEPTTPIYREQPTTIKQNDNKITTNTSINNLKQADTDEKKLSKVKFSLKVGNKKVSLKWSKVKGASGYTIYYKTSKKGKWKKLKNLSAKKTEYVKKKLKSGKILLKHIRK